MYSSRGSNAYGQQSYGGGQSGYAQNLGAAYSGSSVGGLDGVAQHSLASRHSSMLGASQEADVGGYRGYASAGAHYGSQHGAVYGSASISGAQQASTISAKGSGPLALEGRDVYASAVTESPKFASGDYVPSSHGYGLKGDQLYTEKLPDYPTADRRQYGDRQSAYLGRDVQGDPAVRYVDSVGFGHQHQPEMYERIDQASMLRQEQLLKSQSMQSTALDGGARKIDYLAARGAASGHPTQDLAPYGGRMDANPRSASMLSTSSYTGQHTPSILGAAPRRSVDDLLYPQSSSNPGYGVSLPPGRDYGTGKGLHGTSLELDYLGGHPRVDGRRDDKASYLREFELREQERRQELLREREKERGRERERERERGRERERERKRERERILERREKERERARERERKRAVEIKRERTPTRASRDRRGSASVKEGRSLRRDSPSHEALHRRRSPVKEKRREYVCKVHASSLVDVERDYLSVNKRYPRLFISPEFSKAVVNWPKENLNLSIHAPVSFEHYFVEDESVAGSKGPSTKVLTEQHVKPEVGSTVWNAKIILMSGLSKNAQDDLSSDKSLDDRIPHICNVLRFAVLKKNHSFMAIGGPWDFADGGDPAVDDSALIRTAIRHARDIIQVDLQHCHNWNRFLEIHYERYGEDGFFTHKEVTVLFVPDLSECLPSLDVWRDQWLAHKKAIAERECQVSLKKERSREKKEVQKDKETDSKKVDKTENIKESTVSAVNKKEKDGNDVKGKADAQRGGENVKKLAKIAQSETDEEAKSIDKDQGEAIDSPKADSVKPGKKKIIRRIVKQKVIDKTPDAADNAGGENGISGISVEPSETSADPSGVKTFVRKKIIKKVPVGKPTQNEAKDLQNEEKAENETVCSENKLKDAAETGAAAVVLGSNVKTTIKKKIIKRVLKRKLTGAGSSDGASATKKDEKRAALVSKETELVSRQTADGEKSLPPEQIEAAKEDEKGADGKNGSGTKVDIKSDKQVDMKDNHNDKRGKSKEDENSKNEKKDKDGKDDSRSKSDKDLKEKKRLEEPPRHPGLILQTKGNKETKLRSLSLSMDSLLDYSDKDTEESTFELSLFAESFHEMLQYQMGSRLLTFLRKLRVKFVTKRNQLKRQREEMDEKDKDKDKKKSTKRPKTTELPVKIESANAKTSSADQSDDKTNMTEESAGQSDDKNMTKEDNSFEHVNEEKSNDEEESNDEDLEEDPEECEEMEEPEEYEELEAPSRDLSNENSKDEEKTIVDDGQESFAVAEKDKAEEAAKGKTRVEDAKTMVKSNESQIGHVVVQRGKKEPNAGKEAVVDKELLEAFRFFDRNQTGYIRVEDMRLIIHNLRKFLSHRDVKELVQSALLLSNTGRDDRILYNKLVRMIDV